RKSASREKEVVPDVRHEPAVDLLVCSRAMRRVARAAPKPTHVLAVAAAGTLVVCAGFFACNGRVTKPECSEMLDKYIDLVVASEPELTTLSPAEANAAREMKKALRKSDAAYRRVQDQCEREVSRKEYRCAMKAPTPETWQACID